MRHSEVGVILGVLLVAGLAHAINMFGAPQYQHDEGYFMGKAWSFVTSGRFDPYSFTYEQPPFGYVQLGVWACVTGGFATFGTAMDSGRVFMLVLDLLSTACVYAIARRVTANVVIATLAALLFVVSPLAIFFHRPVYLDNMATFWMLVSLLPLVRTRVTHKGVVTSGLAMGLSILSKIPTAVLVPACICFLLFWAPVRRRTLTAVVWIATLSAVLAVYLLYGALRGELFPLSGPGPDGYPRPSLIGGLLWEASRGRDGGLINPQSQFWHFVGVWIQADPVLVVGGTAGSFLCLMAIRSNRAAGLLGLATFSWWALFGRGGVVEIYHLIPAIPLLALCLAIACHIVVSAVRSLGNLRSTIIRSLLAEDLRDPVVAALLVSWIVLGLLVRAAWTILAQWFSSHAWARSIVLRKILSIDPRALVAAVILTAMVLSGYRSPTLGFAANHVLLWNEQRTAGQRAAIDWVTRHVPASSTLLVESFMWPDLHDGAHGKVWMHAFPYVQAEHERRIREGILHNDWRGIDYLVGGRILLNFAYRTPHPRYVSTILVTEALRHAEIVAAFNNPNYPVWVFRVDHTGGP